MKVISGGQIGVDIAALRAAKLAEIETGGYAPAGYRTKLGSNPELGSVYRLIPVLTSREYPPRTRLNVEYSDLTLLICFKLTSPGEKCTLKAMQRYQKPGFGVRMSKTPQGLAISHSAEQVVKALTDHDVKTLNVAGNSDIEIEQDIEDYLYEVFTLWKKSQSPIS